jgi:hypothetical protein
MLTLADCHWPTVDEPFSSALREAVAYALEHYELVGIVACGSIMRGEAGPSSDWDLHAIHGTPIRQRVQQVFQGVPVELFVNPPASLRGYFEDEHAQLSPSTAHMLATGHVVCASDPVVAELVAEARAWLVKPVAVSEAQLVQKRYFAVDQLDNARDVQQSDPAAARRLLNQAVDLMLAYVFWAERRFLPRHKRFLSDLHEFNPEVAELARNFFVTGDLERAFDLADQIAVATVGETGFFAWSSPPEAVESNV